MEHVIVRDTGFATDDWLAEIVSFDDTGAATARAVCVTPDVDPALLAPCLEHLEMIVIGFASFADGRGFTLAKRLRLMGYGGRLRAKGHLLADQYAMARRAGFDEVEIDADLAARQPEDQWLFRADWQSGDYQARLRG